MRKPTIFISLLLIVVMLVMQMPAPLAAHDGLPPVRNPMAQDANEMDAQIANDWMLLLYELVRDEALNAPAAARFYAYSGVALYEAVYFGIPNNFSLGGQLDGLPLLPYPEDGLDYDWPSVANGSLHTVISGLFNESDGSAETFTRIDAMREQQSTLRLAEVDAEVVERSLALGDEIGAALMLWISSDNFGPTRKLDYVLPESDEAEWLWVRTDESVPPMEPYWGQLRPIGLDFPEQCNVLMRMEFSTDPSSTFYAQAAEVLETSDNLTDEQEEIALFWIDTPGITGAPSGHWVMIEMQLVEQLDLSLGRAAEMYALVGIALGDAFISAWNLKYSVNLLRPVTYIGRYLRRGWAPFVQTPPFPEYPSGHSVVSGAAAEVLTTMFGMVHFVDRTPIINGHQPFERSFTSFEAAAYEAAISRLYGGIHYRAAIENGLAQGRCVGDRVLSNIRLRSVPQGEG